MVWCLRIDFQMDNLFYLKQSRKSKGKHSGCYFGSYVHLKGEMN